MAVSFLCKASVAVPALLMAVGASAATLGSNWATTVAKPTTLRQGDRVTGALPANQRVRIVVTLKMRDRAGLEGFIAHSSRNALGAVANPMSRHDFMANHAPTQEQAQRVADYLTRSGFTDVQISSNRMQVTANGTSLAARAAFQTYLVGVKTKEGRSAFANSDAVRIPQSLQDIVLSVTGLQSVHRPHTFARQLKTLSTSSSLTGHYPDEFSSIYGGTGVPTAAGITVGIITEGDLTQTIADLNAFTSARGLAAVTTQTVNTGGTSSDTSGTVEWNLDSQDVVGAAGGQVGKIIFYNIPDLTDEGLVADIGTVVDANEAKVINVSLGECELGAQEDGSLAAGDDLFAVAASQGQTFSVSSGDSGADECGIGSPSASYPASSPYVMAISGTTLFARSGGAWSGEIAWVDSGGSPSLIEPKPWWQGELVPGTMRGTADVAFAGDPQTGSKIYYYGSPVTVGGTSLSAPIFSGLWARVLAVKGTDIGFAGPIIYGLPSSAFHDITIGNNRGEVTRRGYDFVTGRGSLNIGVAMNYIEGDK